MKKLSLKFVVGIFLLMGVVGCMLLPAVSAGECIHCGKYLRSYNVQLKHALEAHQIQEVCPLCREPVQSKRWFDRHMKENHPERWRRWVEHGEAFQSKGVPLKELENKPKDKR